MMHKPGSAPEASGAPEPSPLLPLLTWLPLFVVLAGIFGVRAVLRRRQRALLPFNQENGKGLTLLAEGDVAGARAVFAQLVDRAPAGAFRGVARLNLADADMRLGRFGETVRSLVEIEGSRGLEPKSEVRRLAAAHLAIAHGLSGDLGAAESWIAEAERRLDESDLARVARALIIEARAILLLRRGDAVAAASLLSREWRQLAGSLNELSLRPLRLLRAFALAESGGAREQGAVEAQLAALRPVVPGDVDYLGAAWPAMAAFLRLRLA
jgi:ATP/maltotriose-dependent transcriptional regulator MalT